MSVIDRLFNLLRVVSVYAGPGRLTQAQTDKLEQAYRLIQEVGQEISGK